MKKTNKRPLQRYVPGVLDETDVESLKISLNDELWDISTELLGTRKDLDGLYDEHLLLESEKDNLYAMIEEYYNVSTENGVALAEKILKMEARVDKNKATLEEESRVRADSNSALAERILTLKADVELGEDKMSAGLKEESRARADADGALAEKILQLNANMTTNQIETGAMITEETRVRVSADEALAENIKNLRADMETENSSTSAAIREETRARVTADEALAESVKSLRADVDAGDETLASYIKDTNKVISNLEETMATNVLELNSSITSVGQGAKDDLKEAQEALNKAIAEGDEAEAERLRKEIERLQGIIDKNKTELESSIKQTNQTITTLEETMATSKLELESKISSSESNAVAEANKQAQEALTAAEKALEDAIKRGDDAEAKKLQDEVNRLTGIINGNHNSIMSTLRNEYVTNSNLNSTMASQATTLKSDYNGKFSTVNQTLSTTANKLGQVESKWSVTVDSSTGAVGGVSLISGSNARSEFRVQADKMVFMSGNTAVRPITIEGNKAAFNNVIIREDCVVMGTLYADRIVGLPVGKNFSLGVININPNPNWQNIVSLPYPSSHGRFSMELMFGGVPEFKMTGDSSIKFRILVNGNVAWEMGSVTTAMSTWTPCGYLGGRKVSGGGSGGTVTVQAYVPEHARGGFDFQWPGGFLYSAINSPTFWQ